MNYKLLALPILGMFASLCAFALEAPKLLPFQGRLTDQNGVAVSNGVRLVQFKIFDVPTGGSPVWAGELHRTTVNGELVNVMLGDAVRSIYFETTNTVAKANMGRWPSESEWFQAAGNQAAVQNLPVHADALQQQLLVS